MFLCVKMCSVHKYVSVHIQSYTKEIVSGVEYERKFLKDGS